MFYFIWGCQNLRYQNRSWANWISSFVYLNVFSFSCGKRLISIEEKIATIWLWKRRNTVELFRLNLSLLFTGCSRPWIQVRTHKLELRLILFNMNFFSWTTCQWSADIVFWMFMSVKISAESTFLFSCRRCDSIYSDISIHMSF